jgi:phosphoribosylformylglycinamidine synthase subunit PurS
MTEEVPIPPHPTSPTRGEGIIARVIVTPKPVVNDPQGLTVRHGLRSLGFGEVEQVRVGKYIEVSLEAPDEETARRRVGEMCEKLLANHVIEDFRFDLVLEAAASPAGSP